MATNVMLMIDDDLSPEKEVTHPETGLKFVIVPLDIKMRQKLLKAVRGKDGVDAAKHNGLIVDAAVKRWQHVGMAGSAAECSSENKIRFGARFSSIADWIYEQATNPLLFAVELDDAKND